MYRTRRKVTSGLVVAILLVSACGDDDENSSPSSAQAAPGTNATEPATATSGSTQPATTAEVTKPPVTAATSPDTTTDHGEMAGVGSGASELRSGLTSLLQEHVYLAGAAIATAVGAGGDMEAPAVASAVATLDENSVALSEAVASVYGDDAGAQFLELWRKHIGFFVDYTLGGATGDMAKQDAAKQALDAYRADFGAFIDSATGGQLPADAVADNLQVHVNTLLDAVDAVLDGSPSVFPKLRTAAQHMPGTALALSDAISMQMGDEPAGTTAPGTSATVTVKTFNFQPDPLVVPAGTTITFHNEDKIEHTVTAGTREAPTPDAFDGRLTEQGSTFELTLDEPGTYDYFCSRHPGEGMTATITVE